MKRAHVIFIVTAALTLGCSLGYFGGRVMEMQNAPLVHKLKAPLMLAGGADSPHTYLLPAGTSLYYDQAFPEGFVRYKVYVNVEGVSLESSQSTEKFWLDPLTAFPVGRMQLAQLLRDYPLTRDELKSILNGGALTKEDVRAVLEEYVRSAP